MHDLFGKKIILSETFENLTTLTREGWQIAMGEAEFCDHQARDHGYEPGHGCQDKDTLRAHQIGQAGQMACYGWAGLEWISTEGDYNRPDMLGLFQIRTRSQAGQPMCCHPNDDDDWCMICMEMTGKARQFRTVGFSMGRICKREPLQALYGRPPQHWMPQAKLEKDWRVLLRLIHARAEDLGVPWQPLAKKIVSE